MGLNIVVGVLVDADEEYAEMVRTDFTDIGELLERAGAGPWAEPATRQATDFDMWGYSGLHTVRRLAVHLGVRTAARARTSPGARSLRAG